MRRQWGEQAVQRYGLVLIVGLGLVVRLVQISGRGMQYDDLFSVFLSARSLPDIVRGTAADTMPPLYYFLLHAWMQLWNGGSSLPPDWYLRIPTIVLSLLAVYLVYRLVIEIFADRTAGLIAALLAAFSPFMYYHAQDVRNYALLLCCQLGYLIFFTRLEKSEDPGLRPAWRDWAGLVVCGVAGLYTHNVAIFGIALPNILLLLRRKWSLLAKLIGVQILMGLLFLPWLVLVPGQFMKVQRAWWLGQPGLIDLLQVPIMWTSGLPLPGIWLSVGFLLGLETAVLIALAGFHQRKDRGVQSLGLFLLAQPALLFIVSYIVRPIFVPRAFILAALVFYAAAGRLIHVSWSVEVKGVRQAGVGRLILGGFLLAFVMGLPIQATYSSFPRSPFEDAAVSLANQARPGDIVLHDNKLSYFPMHYYAPGLTQVFLSDVPGSGNDTFAPQSQDAMGIFPAENIDQAVGTGQTVYFVVFHQAIEESAGSGAVKYPPLAWLDERYALKGSQVFNDLEVYAYSHR